MQDSCNDLNRPFSGPVRHVIIVLSSAMQRVTNSFYFKAYAIFYFWELEPVFLRLKQQRIEKKVLVCL